MNEIRTVQGLTRVRWVRGAAVAAGVGLLALLSPLLWAAASGGMGLLAVGAVLLAGFACMQALPLLGQKLENRLLALRKAEARANPIEQLQMEVLRRAERLTTFRKALVTVGGQIETIKQMLAERRHKDPNHVLEPQQRALARLQQFHSLNLNRLTQAHAALEDFRAVVERKNSEWTIALAIDKTAQLMDPNAADHLMQDLLTDSALRSVQDRFNTVFAELDIQMSSVGAPTSTLLDEGSFEHMEVLSQPERITQRKTS
jgi:hypothetical protein